MYQRIGKPVLDRSLAALGLIALSPALLVLALVVRLRLGSPVFFRQTRPGLHGRPFEMIKFRTMTDERDDDGALLPDAERLPSFGRFIRSTSLDELPELWNVLHGEMSLVGPRPLLTQYLGLYTAEQARRHEVKPGITGWAQINGRNAASWPERFEMDLWYVEHCSLRTDFRILGLTLLKAFKREGVNQPGHATVTYFTGTE